MTKKVLIVATSASKLAGGDTGCWMEEIAAPYFTFKEAGYDITIASLAGGEIPFDEASLNPPFLTKEAEKFVLDDACMKLVTESVALKDVTVSDFDAIFLPGGHGTVVDFPSSPELATALGSLFDAGKIVSAVCHGPVGFANAKSLATGEPIVKGKKVTGFSNSEEKAVGKEDIVPFMLEDKLKELGAVYESGPDWGVHAVRDGNLITGQNPGSSAAMAKLVVEALAA